MINMSIKIMKKKIYLHLYYKSSISLSILSATSGYFHSECSVLILSLSSIGPQLILSFSRFTSFSFSRQRSLETTSVLQLYILKSLPSCPSKLKKILSQKSFISMTRNKDRWQSLQCNIQIMYMFTKREKKSTNQVHVLILR